MNTYYTPFRQNIKNNIIKQTVKEKIMNIINDNTEDYNFINEITNEISASSDNIFKNADIKQIQENYKEIIIEDLTRYFYDICIEKLILYNQDNEDNFITNFNKPENEDLYIIINNNVCNNNIKYGILDEYKDTAINYETFTREELQKFQNTFNQNEFIILTNEKFIFVVNLDFIEEELVNGCNVSLI